MFFFNKEELQQRLIGNDIDKTAVNKLKKILPFVETYNINALKNVARWQYEIDETDHLIIIGNPPYNDVTSQNKKRLKGIGYEIDDDIKRRDIGMSFLLSYEKLNADVVCILHPLSYLIKKTNFNSLKNFFEKYTLKNSLIVSSSTFVNSSKNAFPILIGLYIKDEIGMDYDYIQRYKFKTIEGTSFSLIDFEYIGNFIQKYPQKKKKLNKNSLFFYTLRDINALKRNKTFLNKNINNAIEIDIKKLDYYIYVDIFKDYINRLPYYFGNLDIIINDTLFQKYKKFFINKGIKKHPFLANFYKIEKLDDNIVNIKIDEYFKKLLKEHIKK